MNPNEQQQDYAAPKDEVVEVDVVETVATAGVETGNGKANIFSIIGYILPILFFVPLLSDKTKNVPAVRFHANQQLVLLLSAIVLNIVVSILVGMIPALAFLAQVVYLVIVVFAVLGILHAVKGEQKPLPVIGGFKIIK